MLILHYQVNIIIIDFLPNNQIIISHIDKILLPTYKDEDHNLILGKVNWWPLMPIQCQ